MSNAGADAAPVTFEFDAEVTDVDVLVPTTLPLSVKAGDRIRGRFSFEPMDVPATTSSTNTTQHLGATFHVGATALETADYLLRVRNNSLVIDAPELLTDDIWLGCTSVGPTACHPNVVPSTDDIIWWFSLPLVGDGSVLDGADIPDDPSVWKQLTPSYLSLTFQEFKVADVMRITAKVDSFKVVPEPASAVLSLSWVIAGLFVISTCRRCSQR